MIFTFSTDLPSSYNGLAVLASGPGTENVPGKEFVIAQEDGIITGVFEIHFETSGGPFKQAILLNDLLAIGLYQFLYLYDLKRKHFICKYEMEGYFGYLYIHEGKLYVTDAACMYCLESNGNLVWQNGNLGIDGVLIERFDGGRIYGSGEWDPPGGWENFVLDIETGNSM